MRLLLLLTMLFVPVAVSAQVATPVLPTSADVLVLPALGDILTIAPIASRNTLVSPTLCNLAPAPAGILSPLINPTGAEVEDPFQAPGSGKVCRLAIPLNIPNGTGYRAVAIFNGLCGTTACSSPRSAVGVPPFDIVGTQASPVAPTKPAVRP